MNLNKLPILIILIVQFFIWPTVARAEDFNLHVTPVKIKFLDSVHNTQKINLSLFSPNTKDKTLYPFALDWKLANGKFNYELSNWFNIDQEEIGINDTQDHQVVYEMTPPVGTPIGQYLKLIGVSNQEFSCETSDSAPIMIGVPVIAQLAKDLPILANDLSLPEDQRLYSKLSLVEFKQRYNPLNFEQVFDVKIANQGNISGTPIGYILIKNKAGTVLDKISLNPSLAAILPTEERISSFQFRHNGILSGTLTAQLWLGSDDSLQTESPILMKELSFSFISQNLMVTTLELLLLIIIARLIVIPHLNSNFKAVGHLVVIIAIIGVLFQIYSGYRNNQTLGVLAPNDDTKQVNITANVTDNNGLKVVQSEGRKIVTITPQDPHSWQLWAMTCKYPRVLATGNNQIEGSTTIVLTGADARVPLLLLTERF